MLANIYLHYVFDLWVEVWRRKVATGDVIVVNGKHALTLDVDDHGPAGNGYAALGRLHCAGLLEDAGYHVTAVGDGAAPSGFQSLVPTRRIDRSASPPAVPLTRSKLDAPAKAGDAAAAARSTPRTMVFMRLTIDS